MGDAAGQLADHLHLACLVKLRQGAFALGEHGRDTFFQAFVEFAQLVLGAYPRADVHAHAEQAAGGMLLVHQRRDLVLHPHRIAVGANVAAAHLERAPVAPPGAAGRAKSAGSRMSCMRRPSRVSRERPAISQ